MEKKSIYPKCEHLRIVMYSNTIFGVWPFIFEDYPVLKKIYDVYGKITLVYFLWITVTGYMQLFVILHDRPIRISELMLNISITFIYTVTLWRAALIKGERMKKIIKNIIAWEKKINDSGDEKIIGIINNHAWRNKVVSQFYALTVFIVTSLFLFHPLSQAGAKVYNRETNVTRLIKPFPLSAWLPFDAQEHYLPAYIILFLEAASGATFVSNSDTFMFGIITFPLGQMAILNHMLSNFHEYVEKVQKQLKIERDEASIRTLRECVLRHKDIIEYIIDFNRENGMLVLADFLQSSLEMAAITLELLFVELNIMNLIFSINFAFCIFIRLLGYYWHANEIIVESSNTGLAIWNSKWYEEPQKTQKLMLIMMLRCSRPLSMDIGPFNTMSINTLIGILKTTYSYSMVIYRGKQK